MNVLDDIGLFLSSRALFFVYSCGVEKETNSRVIRAPKPMQNS